jgi:hypothetical protein
LPRFVTDQAYPLLKLILLFKPDTGTQEMQKKKSNPESKRHTRTKDVPATQGMLRLVRSEIKSDIRGLRSEMKSGFYRTDSKIEQVLSEVARVGSLVEEQNSRNQIVLEGLTNLFHRQDFENRRMGEIENIVLGLAARSRR